MPLPRWFPIVLLSSLCIPAYAHDAAKEMAGAATTWLQSLDDAQRAQATFPLGDSERENWYYVPIARKGLPFRDMKDPQRQLARGLLAAGLSQRGQLQVEAIAALENVLHAMEGTARRNPELYYFSVFGQPSPTGTWGWRFEGHHVSVNFTLVEGTKIAVTPFFFGSNPAEVRIDHPQRGRRALAAEEDEGRALMKSFNAAQQRQVLIADQAPNEIITANNRQVQPSTPAGLAYAQMEADQQSRLRALVQVYADRLRPEVAGDEMKKIADRGWEQVHFAWAGGLERGDAHYYRIQGPAFLIEYDNSQNEANHIHTTWRNFDGDFGRDLLREHYAREHQAAK